MEATGHIPDDILMDLNQMIQDSGDVTHWLSQPNPALDGLTPHDVIKQGESDRIRRIIYSLRSGEPL